MTLKIRLLSDLHIEGHWYDYDFAGEDVLVLAGDIHTRNRHHELIEQIPSSVQIIFVAGNHEYYGSEVGEVKGYLRGLSRDYENFHWLNNESFTYGDVRFFGGTMFTDFSLHGEAARVMAEIDAARGINDFRTISVKESNGLCRWTIADHKSEFDKFERELTRWVHDTEGDRRVVISHFAPSPQTVAPQYAASNLNPYFTVDMERHMGWEGLWLFGHTHISYDGMVGDTHLVANAKGYGGENWKNFNDKLLLEI